MNGEHRVIPTVVLEYLMRSALFLCAVHAVVINQKKNTPLILTTAYRMHTKVSFCILIEHQIETDDCGIDTHFHNVQYKVA